MFDALAIVTDRLLLRPVELGDAALTAALMTPSISACLTSWPPRMSVADAFRRIIESRHETRIRHWIDWGIFLKDGISLVGWVGMGRKPERAAISLGYWIGEGFQGQGFATEAASVIVARAQAIFGAGPIEALALPANIASISVLRRLGFRETCRQRQPVASRGRSEEFVRFVLGQEIQDDLEPCRAVGPLWLHAGNPALRASVAADQVPAPL